MKCVLLFVTLLVTSWADDQLAAESSYGWPPEAWLQTWKGADVAEPIAELYVEPAPIYKDNRIGRHGLGFEKRYARADGLRMPVTADNIQHVGYRTLRKENPYTPL